MSHCCLCGLLCSLDGAATESAKLQSENLATLIRIPTVQDCHRRNQWLACSSERNAVDRFAKADNGVSDNLSAQVATLAALFKPAHRALLWIDGADVNTTRSVVSLAQAIRGTVHIGQSSGAAAAHRVLANQGWVGSSLAEVASHADLIITLGGGLRSEAPLLAQRFFKPALAGGRAEWFHIDAHRDAYLPPASGAHTDENQPNYTAVWPREMWYKQLTHILLALQPESQPEAQLGARQGATKDESVAALVSKLQRAKNTVWLWDAEEFHDAVDELCISRLLAISRLLMLSARCSLLGLDAQVGRVTAQETLLWLTGCSGTADFDGQRWSQPQSLDHNTLEEWQHVFDSILVVRSVPSPHPLPNLTAGHFLVAEQSLLPDRVATSRLTRVATVGIDCDGHLMRGDRATMMYCAASESASLQDKQAQSRLPTAAALLDQVRDQLQSGATTNAN